MAIALEQSEQPDEQAEQSDIYAVTLGRIVRLAMASAELSSVRRVGLTGDANRLDVWVIQADESLDDEERIYALARDCFAQDGRPEISVHVTSLARVTERDLPSMISVFER